ncbi:RNA polymerase II accessory factor CDC73 [Besnoitia besnoiti]|uniref:RNA polymerase II accessory factor CDC73 n=1 Tax=Besnoitia besnoiti TaxID=94643 RepID=A0A2A9MAT6_BESBE|nr:RNA polymerase II accessory factor CDC73 [Besnoitia besnoiti]PFH32502.1 RNA polymerase II accessory factor CDC73 [Besnoitia besnoiti]
MKGGATGRPEGETLPVAPQSSSAEAGDASPAAPASPPPLGERGEGSGFSVDPLALIHASLNKKSPSFSAPSSGSPSCHLEHVRGEEALVFPDLNCYLPAGLPSGLESRRKESFSLADIFLLLSTPKELYTYSHITQKGHRYINVLERSKIIAFFESLASSSSPSKLAAAASAVAPLGGGGAGAVVARLEEKARLPGSVFSSSLEDASVSRAQTLFVLDASRPVNLPGLLDGSRGRLLDGEEGGEDEGSLPAWGRREKNFISDERLEKVMPQTWTDVDTRQVALYAKNAVHAYDEARRRKRGEGHAGEGGEKKLKVSEQGEREDGEQEKEEKAEQRMREALASLAFARLERPLVQRCSAVQLAGFSFESILQKFREVEKERVAGRSLAVFSHLPKKDGSHPSSRMRLDGSIAARRPDASRPSGAPGCARREAETKSSRICVLEEVYAYRKRKAIILIPPVTSVGGSSSSSALLNRYNIVDLLENGQFVFPQEAKERAAREGTLGADQGRLEVRHEIRNKVFKFMLVETSYAAKFTPEQWKCVVAVVINAASASSLKLHFGGWPFRDWIDLFLSYKGVMFAYEEDAIPPEVSSLSVKVIRLSRSHRYNDAAAASDFWATLEEFLLQPRRLCLAFDRRLDAALNRDNGALKPGASSGFASSRGLGDAQRVPGASGSAYGAGAGEALHPAHQHHFAHHPHSGVGTPLHGHPGPGIPGGGYHRAQQAVHYGQR